MPGLGYNNFEIIEYTENCKNCGSSELKSGKCAHCGGHRRICKYCKGKKI